MYIYTYVCLNIAFAKFSASFLLFKIRSIFSTEFGLASIEYINVSPYICILYVYKKTILVRNFFNLNFISFQWNLCLTN